MSAKRKPEAVREHRQGQNVIGMTIEILAFAPVFVDTKAKVRALEGGDA